jgi:alkaline phosphatase D
MSPLTRLELLARAGSGVVVLAADPFVTIADAAKKPRLLRGRFGEGVLAGDPTPTGITLLTRLRGAEGSGRVLLELARDPGFRHVVSRSTLKTGPALGHAVKARVENLKPHRRYWYRFSTRNADSRVGRFTTALPADSRQTVRFGVFNAQDFAAGYFNAHTRLAKEDLDFVLNLGNYIYAESPISGPDVRTLPRAGRPLTLGDFRARYTAYRQDAGLRAMHAAHAMVSCWDDGEVAPGYAGTNPSSPYAFVPKAEAYRAWFEAMPHYPPRSDLTRVFQRLRFGRALELVLLDTRQYRDVQPCDNSGDTECPDLDAPREMLGARQLEYAAQRLGDSGAAWKLLATPAQFAGYLTGPGRYADFDAWQGYPRARRDLLQALSDEEVAGAVFLSGGLRRFLAGDILDPEGGAIAPEFTCGSVSARPDDDVDRSVSINSPIVHDDPQHHGYMICEAAGGHLTVRYSKLQTVETRSTARVAGQSWTLARGERSVGQ